MKAKGFIASTLHELLSTKMKPVSCIVEGIAPRCKSSPLLRGALALSLHSYSKASPPSSNNTGLYP